MTDRIILIDAYAQIYRMFYGIRGNLKTKEGMPTNAIYGMARLLLQLERDFPHQYAAVAYDLGECSTRGALIDDYKATRKPMPEELRAQLPYIKRWIEAAGWPIIIEEGREADDLMAAVAVNHPDMNSLIVSQDKDLMQLVSDHVHQLVSGAKSTMNEMDAEAVTEKFGVRPDQVLDYLCLLGDNVDNIPGVQGIGAKTAVKLLNQFGSIEGIYARIDEVKPPRIQENLRNSKERLDLNRKLISLYTDLPADWKGPASMTRTAPDEKKIMELCDELNFNTIRKEMEKHFESLRNPTLF